MKTEKVIYKENILLRMLSRLRSYYQLTKPRLSFLVVFSAVFGFLMATGSSGFSWVQLALISLGGYLITGASNTLNQVLEVEYDRKMSRTANRPLPVGDLPGSEAVAFALITGFGGIIMLGLMFNLVTALLGLIALLSYAFVYTPLKRVGSISVFVGAVPGAMPPLIGWAAVTGDITLPAVVLFLIQFFWQFPHFWAIAWILDEDYGKAGFKLLPSSSGRSRFTASIIFMYSAILIPIVLLPWKLDLAGPGAIIALLIGGIGMTWCAWRLLKTRDKKSARLLMFFSFIYLPLFQIAFLIDKI